VVRIISRTPSLADLPSSAMSLMKIAHSALSTLRHVVIRDDSMGANIVFGIG